MEPSPSVVMKGRLVGSIIFVRSLVPQRGPYIWNWPRICLAETFLLLFRKFVARRSLPRLMISDNGTYFKSTAKFLLEIALEPSVQDFLGDHSMEWRFVSPRAPWQGGFYERLIGIVKGTLRKMLFKCRISFHAT